MTTPDAGPSGASEDPPQPHESAGSLGRFGAFARRRRDRRAPVWRLTLAYLCSVLLHIALAADIVWVAASLSGAPSVEPEVAWADLAISEPGTGGSATAGPAEEGGGGQGGGGRPAHPPPLRPMVTCPTCGPMTTCQ